MKKHSYIGDEEMKKEYRIEGLHCASCGAKIEEALSKLQGIEGLSLNFVAKKLEIIYENYSDDKFEEIKKVSDTIEKGVIITEIAETDIEKIKIDGIHCAGCSEKIIEEIRKNPKIRNLNFNFTTETLEIEKERTMTREALLRIVKEAVNLHEPNSEVYFKGEKTKEKKKVNLLAKHKLEIIGLGLFALSFFIEEGFISTLGLFVAYILVGGDVVKKSIENIKGGQLFDENFLMTIATFGAFAIGETKEAVGVMLFYKIGEFFQGLAVERSRNSIEDLMDIRPDYANLKTETELKVVDPKEVLIGDVVVVKAGEKIPLDGVIKKGTSTLDTSALTGESLPRDVGVGSKVLGGMINKTGLLEIEVTSDYNHSTVAKILDLVENAGAKKANMEKYITKFSKYYTPAVVVLALLLAVVPPMFMGDFSLWFYRALIFLVISCPCALVISIPLGFFGGIGGASREGVLVKGGNFLEALNNIDAIVFDKTGTLTKGNFRVAKVNSKEISEEELYYYTAHLESKSNHPIAKSILDSYNKKVDENLLEELKEVEGQGLSGVVNGKKVLAGNEKLMRANSIEFEKEKAIGTKLYVAIDDRFVGSFVIEDEIKGESKEVINFLNSSGIDTYMLTGDNELVASDVSEKLGIKNYIASLLPHEKVKNFEEIKKNHNVTAFVGDGINDAPVLRGADIGIAMGGLGSDAAIEAADVVLMTDNLEKLEVGINVARKTRKIVKQNIIFALGIKGFVMILGVFGLASMWGAVFSDVGVTLIAVLNSIRALKVDKI